MIGCIKGKIIEVSEGKILVLTQMGVGYEIYFAKDLVLNEERLLYTSNIIKETSNELYGFLNQIDKKIFELLISVKGVGPKSAFSMINTLGPKEIIQAIVLDNKKALSSAPGIGKKAASQIVLDLSEKISKFNSGQLLVDSPQSLFNEMTVTTNPSSKFLDEAVMACKELGFKEASVISIAQEIIKNNDISSSEQLIHHVLREL